MRKPSSKNLPTEYPEFEIREYQKQGRTLPYRWMLPQDYDGEASYPLVLFFHGAGERGSDNEISLTHFAPLVLGEDKRVNFPCFVLVPQCPKEVRWVEVDWALLGHDFPEEPGWPLSQTMDLLDLLMEAYSIDPKRLYVTGLSMGGFATWDALARYPQRFAAGVPVCGGGDPKVVSQMKETPIWAFHGALDRTVKPSRSREMIQALEKAGAEPKYTEYPEVYHGSWKPAYADKTLLPWMFGQTLKK